MSRNTLKNHRPTLTLIEQAAHTKAAISEASHFITHGLNQEALETLRKLKTNLDQLQTKTRK